ncbi:Fc.00g088460.m01.CDS01 [Cosmosporella sp. VM-42]
MRGFEKESGRPFELPEIPVIISQAYAKKMGIRHNALAIENTLEPGETICAAILRLYSSASHSLMEASQWSSLKKATAVQAAGGWQSLKKAARNKMATADENRPAS